MMVKGYGSGATSKTSTDYDGYIYQYELVGNGGKKRYLSREECVWTA
jgi:hypothetical protein